MTGQSFSRNLSGGKTGGTDWGKWLGLLTMGMSMLGGGGGPAQVSQQGGGQAPRMPDPVPMQGQEDIDWEKIFAMLAQQSTPPLYNIMPQLYQGIPMQQQQGMGGQ